MRSFKIALPRGTIFLYVHPRLIVITPRTKIYPILPHGPEADGQSANLDFNLIGSGPRSTVNASL
jgi:hypothetical protein